MWLKRKSSVAGSFSVNCPQTSDTLPLLPCDSARKKEAGPGNENLLPAEGSVHLESAAWGGGSWPGGRTLNAHTEPVPVNRWHLGTQTRASGCCSIYIQSENTGRGLAPVPLPSVKKFQTLHHRTFITRLSLYVIGIPLHKKKA